MTYKNTFISLIFILAVGMAAWLTLSYYPASSPASQSAAAIPDAYMENVTAVILDKFGKVTMKIVTPRLVHFTENDTTNLIDPQMTLYRKSPKPWFITSKFARATQGIDNVNFWDDVIIHHPADFNNPSTVIKTATLLVHPNNQTAETTDLITLIQPNIIVKAIGMFADMDTGNIKLLSQAQGEYAPTS